MGNGATYPHALNPSALIHGHSHGINTLGTYQGQGAEAALCPLRMARGAHREPWPVRAGLLRGANAAKQQQLTFPLGPGPQAPAAGLPSLRRVPLYPPPCLLSSFGP